MTKEKKQKWYYTTWGIILLLFLFFPLGLFFMWRNARWSKKVKWTVTEIFIFALIVSLNTSGKTSVSPQTTETTVQEAANSFTKEQALQRIQEYRLQKDFPDVGISRGATILDYYYARGEIPAIKNEGWYSEEATQKDTYIVGFKATIGALHNLPKWEVTNNSIIALNGSAIVITPELQKKTEENKEKGSDFEKQVFEYSNSLYKKYEKEAFALNDANPNESYDIKGTRLQEAEEKATRETVQKFGITEKEVIDIISKLQ